MTAYFDQVHDEFNALDPNNISAFCKGIDQIEERLVFDCSVCAQWPGFPEDLRQRVHETILKYGSATLPMDFPRGFDTAEEQLESMHKLCFDLHSIFHDLLNRGLDGPWSDDPRMPLRALYAQCEEVREQLARKQE
jgi:hypothetical protein